MDNKRSLLHNTGLWATLAAFCLWGTLPIYWKSLGHLDPFLILLHRIFWSFCFLLILELRKKALRASLSHLLVKKNALIICVRSLLLSSNWLVFIWAVNSGYIIETSLGYFLNPLLSMLCGVIIFRERPSGLQWTAIALSVAGVGLQIVLFGNIPWVALCLGFSFAIYGAMRKMDNRSSLEGLFLETLVIMPIIIAGLAWYATHGGLGLNISLGQTVLILFSGIFTSTPLLLFAYGAQRLPLSTVGLLQYLSPTISLLIGVFLFGEQLTNGQITSFICIWTALIIYSVESLRLYKKSTRFAWKEAS